MERDLFNNDLKFYTMAINSTKAACLISVIYLVCFQLFLQSGYYTWLYTGNALFCVSIVLYTYLNQVANPTLSLPALAGKGIRFSFASSVLSLAGSAALFLVNYYLFPNQKNEYINLSHGNVSLYAGIKNIKDFLTLTLTNSFPINLVCGSLASFFIVGILNEKNAFGSSKPLSSVKI